MIRFTSVITSISPQLGSNKGGTLITIVGDGFNSDSTIINLGDNLFYNKLNSQIYFDKILIESKSLVDGNYLLNVNVNNQNSSCDSNNCTITISSAYTPLISSISPNIVNDSNTQVEIIGQNFGSNLSQITVKIGRQYCLASNVSDTKIDCKLNGLEVGDQPVLVTTSI